MSDGALYEDYFLKEPSNLPLRQMEHRLGMWASEEGGVEAIQLSFSLDPGTYATVCLREILRSEGGETPHAKPPTRAKRHIRFSESADDVGDSDVEIVDDGGKRSRN